MIHADPIVSKLMRFGPKYLFGLGASAYLFSLGWLRERHRGLVWTICAHFGMKLPARKHPLPTVDVRRVIDGGVDIRLLEPQVADGNVSFTELVVINTFVRRYQTRRMFEIGTFDGRTALNMAVNAPEGSHVFTLDLPAERLDQTQFGVYHGEAKYIRKSQSGARFKGTEYEGRITQLYGDSATFDFSPYFGSMDLVFIDGSHTPDYVLSDSEVALKLVRPEGGVILYHDYYEFATGVTETLGALHRTRPEFAGLKHVEGTALAYVHTGSPKGAIP